ncbi:Unannotated [Lentimonas sp. CC19]|nr:Unannotated [Lentimonas sp. CC4]CAA6683848.1 Unannotated [Lentimonas sp. CC6]CAA6692732.1 Unannotated [Lentimonas sp. CC10]CAA6696702.1 Unannotated [Lentimonas sp. CC19]CAA7072318.1 Unannotated [Lentimonas sp. CC11]CAA7169690.1 Unannotated [Lentimonas sp. CC21]CAA7179511.1 Unannotated [Lentimonas sp. CC8]
MANSLAAFRCILKDRFRTQVLVVTIKSSKAFSNQKHPLDSYLTVSNENPVTYTPLFYSTWWRTRD